MCPSYLDTDVVLALIKPRDWLKEDAEWAVRRVVKKRTSAVTVLEASLVFERGSRSAPLRR